MAQVGDCIQTVLTWRFTGGNEVIQNVFWHVITTTTSGNPCQFIEATVRLNWMPVLATILSDSIHLRELYSVNWVNPVENTLESYSEGVLNGDIPGDHLGDWITYNFRYVKDRPGHRPGLKQFSGVPETCVSNGGIHADYVDEAVAVEGILENAFSSGGFTFSPIVVQRRIGGVDIFPDLGIANPVYWSPPGVQFVGLGHRDSRR